MQEEILLQLKNISVHYGEIKALDNVDIQLDEEEIVALMGPNGAGKSTVLKAIFGLAPIQCGEFLWRKQPITPLPFEMVKRGVAFVPQGRRVFGNLTVIENLEIGGFAVGNKKIIKQRIDEVIQTFPILKERGNQKAKTLSGGQQQILALARGLMTNPQVLLLDEPSLGLAPKFVKEIFSKIKGINKNHKTAILVVEHNIKSLLEVAHRAYILDKGIIVAKDNSQNVIESGVLEKIFTTGQST